MTPDHKSDEEAVKKEEENARKHPENQSLFDMKNLKEVPNQIMIPLTRFFKTVQRQTEKILDDLTGKTKKNKPQFLNKLN